MFFRIVHAKIKGVFSYVSASGRSNASVGAPAYYVFCFHRNYATSSGRRAVGKQKKGYFSKNKQINTLTENDLTLK